jgi:hypothetical protein
MVKTLAKWLFVIGMLVAAPLAHAKWYTVHQISSDSPLVVKDGSTGASYTPSYGYSSSNWQITTPQAFSHAIALTDGGQYEFRLVRVSGSDDSSITGLWDIYRDGALVVDNAIGKAYGLDGAVGDYFKIYVGTPTAYAENWLFSGYITHRFDY